jgi:hypothetical protein
MGKQWRCWLAADGLIRGPRRDSDREMRGPQSCRQVSCRGLRSLASKSHGTGTTNDRKTSFRSSKRRPIQHIKWPFDAPKIWSLQVSVDPRRQMNHEKEKMDAPTRHGGRHTNGRRGAHRRRGQRNGAMLSGDPLNVLWFI